MTQILAEIVLDSITDGGSRLTTWKLTYPRFIHSELLTHRVFSKNSASSRAIPMKKFRDRVELMPAIPIHWGANEKGMQAFNEIVDSQRAVDWWIACRDAALKFHIQGEEIGLHKQIVNRVLEPWMMIVVILTGTDFANFFHLRDHKDAEPNIHMLANEMWNEYRRSLPNIVPVGGWHLPMIQEIDWGKIEELAKDENEKMEIAKKVSTGRCARVSYLTFDGQRDLQEDIRLHDKLLSSAPLHASPSEHQALAVGGRERWANFEGWRQYRSFLPFEKGPVTEDRCSRCGLWGGEHVLMCPEGA
jgi:hypothetical protein